MSTKGAPNSRTNVFLLVNLGCEALFVIDQRLKAQRIEPEKSMKVIHDITSVLLEPKFIESVINGSIHPNAQLLTADHCKFMINDITTCSLMSMDETSMNKMWNLVTMVYKWQLFVSRHKHHLLDITFRHLDAVKNLYPDAKRHLLIDFTKNTILDFWNTCGEQQQQAIYSTSQAWLQCFNTKISLMIRLGFQAMDGSFLPELDQQHYQHFAQCIGDNIYVKSSELSQQQQQNEPNRMDQLAKQLNINQTPSHAASGEDLQPMDAQQFQQQFEKAFSNILFADTDSNSATGAATFSQPQRNANASGCEFVQLVTTASSNVDDVVTMASSGSGTVLNQQLLDLYSKMH